MTLHDLKTWPDPFQALWDGSKTFEIRLDDGRDFQNGDELRLREYSPESHSYSGRCVVAVVTYLAKSPAWGLPTDMVVMAIAQQSRTVAYWP